MSTIALGKAGPVYLEIGQSTLRALRGNEGLELALERLPNGRLSDACKQGLTQNLQAFLKKEAWRPHARAWVAISARGVSLRRIALPKASKENLQQLLLLQIEREFPLSPEQLAWGSQAIVPAKAAGNGSPGQEEYLVAAVKLEAVEEYAELLDACGLSPVFLVGALLRQSLCPPNAHAQTLLDIGRNHSELVFFEAGVPKTIRVLPWGGENITRAIEQKLGLSRTEAEDLKLKYALGRPGDLDLGPRIQTAIEDALDALAASVNGQKIEKIYLTGQSVRLKELAPGLARRLGPGVACEAVDSPVGAGRSAAIQCLRTATERGDGQLPLILKGKQGNGAAAISRPAPWKGIALAASLVLGIFALPYLEALVLKPYLARKLVALNADRRKLAMIDAEWGFFQNLKQNAPPYLDAMFLLAKAAPPGARIDSLSMNRRGELALRCTMQNSQQVADFRSKLIDSGFFANLSVEEQSPSPDRQKLAVRMSALWKPFSARQALAFGPTAEEIEKARTRPREPQMGMPPMMPMMGVPGMPGPMPGPMPGGPPEHPRGARANPPAAVAPGPLPPGALPPGVVMPTAPPPPNP